MCFSQHYYLKIYPSQFLQDKSESFHKNPPYFVWDDATVVKIWQTCLHEYIFLWHVKFHEIVYITNNVSQQFISQQTHAGPGTKKNESRIIHWYLPSFEINTAIIAISTRKDITVMSPNLFVQITTGFWHNLPRFTPCLSEYVYLTACGHISKNICKSPDFCTMVLERNSRLCFCWLRKSLISLRAVLSSVSLKKSFWNNGPRISRGRFCAGRQVLQW